METFEIGGRHARALPDFKLEVFFARWEFQARFHLTASDAETLSMAELLAMGDEEDQAAWHDLRLGYTESWGDPVLRQAIATTYETIDPDQILCFAGVQEGLASTFRALLTSKDHAVVLTPNYQSAESIPLSICSVTGIGLHPENGWAIDLDELRTVLRPSTKVIAVNFPNNPTGFVPDHATWQQLCDVADERGIWLVSDEVYRGVELDPQVTIRQAADATPAGISINVLSKAYGLPGLRIGWIASQNRELLERVARVKHYGSICNSAPSEILARIGVKRQAQLFERTRAQIRDNLSHFEGFFAEFADQFEFEPPVGGCVCYPRYTGPDGAEQFCADLLATAGVLLLPPSIYTSALMPTPSDRFRLGIGRANPEPALDAWREFMYGRQRSSVG